MPAPNQFVEMHRWSSPVERYCEKTKQTIPGAPLEFAEFSTVVQSMEITIPEVMEGGRKYNITTEMKIELDKQFWENANRPDDPIREIKAALLKAIQDYQKNGGSILKKDESAERSITADADVKQDTKLHGAVSSSQDIDISLGGAIFKGVVEGLEVSDPRRPGCRPIPLVALRLTRSLRSQGILAGVSEIVGKAIEAIPAVKTHLEVLQELQLQQQLAIETSLQMSIANQEAHRAASSIAAVSSRPLSPPPPSPPRPPSPPPQSSPPQPRPPPPTATLSATLSATTQVALAGQYAMSQNAVNTVKQLTEIETQAMVDLAGCAKGSGGNDRARSRVAACCCCSVASKVSGSVWCGATALHAPSSSSLLSPPTLLPLSQLRRHHLRALRVGLAFPPPPPPLSLKPSSPSPIGRMSRSAAR